jgi:hypothetical protein
MRQHHPRMNGVAVGMSAATKGTPVSISPEMMVCKYQCDAHYAREILLEALSLATAPP